MNLPALKKVALVGELTLVSLSRLILQLQSNVAELLERLTENPHSIRTVQSVTLVAATPKVVNHKLQLPTGKTPNGWLVSDINANTTVRRNAWDNKTITMQAANNCIIQLEVW